MMLPFVPAFTAVGFNQFDTPIFNAIDGSDMHAVCADYFRMLFDFLASAIFRVSSSPKDNAHASRPFSLPRGSFSRSGLWLRYPAA